MFSLALLSLLAICSACRQAKSLSAAPWKRHEMLENSTDSSHHGLTAALVTGTLAAVPHSTCGQLRDTRPSHASALLFDTCPWGYKGQLSLCELETTHKLNQTRTRAFGIWSHRLRQHEWHGVFAGAWHAENMQNDALRCPEEVPFGRLDL